MLLGIFLVSIRSYFHSCGEGGLKGYCSAYKLCYSSQPFSPYSRCTHSEGSKVTDNTSIVMHCKANAISTLFERSFRRSWQHSFVEIDHEIFSTVILSLPLIQEGQLSVSGERMCAILVNRLEDKACPVNVWLGKLTALDMTPLG